jgi:hypothetical protein
MKKFAIFFVTLIIATVFFNSCNRKTTIAPSQITPTNSVPTTLPILTGIPIPSVSANNPKNYKCPPAEWVDCMPGPDKRSPMCEKDFLNWASENCPNFKGAAY